MNNAEVSVSQMKKQVYNNKKAFEVNKQTAAKRSRQTNVNGKAKSPQKAKSPHKAKGPHKAKSPQSK